MNYDQHLSKLIEALNADKTIPQPYRNSVASSARRLQLEIRGAKTMTNKVPPVDTQPGRVEGSTAASSSDGCTCAPGVLSKQCPVHGSLVM